jgi:hypothetical protein
MDSISSYEFHAIFDRVTDKISLQGKFTPEDIAQQLNETKKKCERQRHRTAKPRLRAKLRQEAIQYRNLIDYGFPERVITEAIVKPKGIIAMTLKYGKTNARQIILSRKKTQIRVQRRRYPPHPQ